MKLHAGHNTLIIPGTAVVNRPYTPSLLLVEDSPVNQQLIAQILRRKGCDVSIANNGEEAIKICENHVFDLIFMDIEMPILDGISATHHIRQIEDFKKVPIIALTGHSDTLNLKGFLNAGLNEYIKKPVNVDHLYKLLDQYIKTPMPSSENNGPSICDIPDFLSEEESPDLLIDKKGLLERVSGKMNFALHIMQLFFKGLEEVEPLLREAIEQANREDIRRYAHRIKGSMANAGVLSGSEAIQTIENESHKLDIKDIASLFEEWKDGIKAAREEYLSMAKDFMCKRKTKLSSKSS